MSPEEAYQQGMMEAQKQMQGADNYSFSGQEMDAKDILRVTLDYERELRDLELSLRGQAEAWNGEQTYVIQVSTPIMSNEGIQTLLDVVRQTTKQAILSDLTKGEANNITEKTAVEVYFSIYTNTNKWNVDRSRRSLAAWNIVKTVKLMLTRGVGGKERSHIYKRTTANEVFHKSDTQFSGSKGFSLNPFSK